MIEEEKLRWRFDVNTFRLIGRDLITDRITALFELVKNCYDANATCVEIFLNNTKTINNKSAITIKDNGYGMTFDDIRDKWMVIGTSFKRKSPVSPPPFNRKCVGEKGIGRFAVDKLSRKTSIITKKINENKKIQVEIDWRCYEDDKGKPELTLFTDIDTKYSYEDSIPEEQGTTLYLTEIREIWTEHDTDRLYKELSKLVSPFYPINPPFDIYLTSTDFVKYTHKLVTSDAIKYSSHIARIDYNKEQNTQEYLYFDKETGQILVKKTKIKEFGGVRMQLYFFNNKAKKDYNAKHKNDDTRIDGVKIYRDGLITTPFAEMQGDRNKQRDILGIDKRLWRDIFNKVGTREIIGIVDITKDENPYITDATNRQDFDDNNYYRKLKEFILDQVDVFTDVKLFEREDKRKESTNDLVQAKEDIDIFIKTIENIAKEDPNLKTKLTPLKNQAKQVSTAVNKGIAEQKKVVNDFLRKENIYLSLMSLQDYAANMSHAVRTTLSKIKDKAEFFKENYPNADLEKYFSLYASEIYDNMETLNKVINYMLSYAGSTVPFEDLDVKDLIVSLFSEYQLRFDNENIKSTIEIRDNFILNANRQFFSDIFQNLIDNSVKALKGIEDKTIKCSGYIEDNNFIVSFSDNGIGIEKEYREKVFEIFHTSTAEEGGAGLGLFIVRTRIEALKGNVEITESEFFPQGTTFKITLPFKQ